MPHRPPPAIGSRAFRQGARGRCARRTAKQVTGATSRRRGRQRSVSAEIGREFRHPARRERARGPMASTPRSSSPVMRRGLRSAGRVMSCPSSQTRGSIRRLDSVHRAPYGRITDQSSDGQTAHPDRPNPNQRFPLVHVERRPPIPECGTQVRKLDLHSEVRDAEYGTASSF